MSSTHDLRFLPEPPSPRRSWMSSLRLFVSSLVVRSALTLLGSAGPVSPSLVSISVSTLARLRLIPTRRNLAARRRARSALLSSPPSPPRAPPPSATSAAARPPSPAPPIASRRRVLRVRPSRARTRRRRRGVSAGTRYPARLRLAIPGHRIAAPRARRRSPATNGSFVVPSGRSHGRICGLGAAPGGGAASNDAGCVTRNRATCASATYRNSVYAFTLRRVARVARARNAASHDATLAPVRVASSDAEIPPGPASRAAAAASATETSPSAGEEKSETPGPFPSPSASVGSVGSIGSVGVHRRPPCASMDPCPSTRTRIPFAASVRCSSDVSASRASALAGYVGGSVSTLAASTGESDARASATAERSASVCPAFGRSHRDVRPRMDAARKSPAASAASATTPPPTARGSSATWKKCASSDKGASPLATSIPARRNVSMARCIASSPTATIISRSARFPATSSGWSTRCMTSILTSSSALANATRDSGGSSVKSRRTRAARGASPRLARRGARTDLFLVRIGIRTVLVRIGIRIAHEVRQGNLVLVVRLRLNARADPRERDPPSRSLSRTRRGTVGPCTPEDAP